MESKTMSWKKWCIIACIAMVVCAFISIPALLGAIAFALLFIIAYGIELLTYNNENYKRYYRDKY